MYLIESYCNIFFFFFIYFKSGILTILLSLWICRYNHTGCSKSLEPLNYLSKLQCKISLKFQGRHQCRPRGPRLILLKTNPNSLKKKLLGYYKLLFDNTNCQGRNSQIGIQGFPELYTLYTKWPPSIESSKCYEVEIPKKLLIKSLFKKKITQKKKKDFTKRTLWCKISNSNNNVFV